METDAPKKKTRMLTVKEVCVSLRKGRTWLWKAERAGVYPPGERRNSRCVRYREDLHNQFKRGEWPSDSDQ